jgi:catechol 2,3-dioxygenase-like lactoylglutathione lyase family enzyme
MHMQAPAKATAVGINHIALEVGNIDDALEFYGALFEFEIESQSETSAFIYFGDQFINFMTPRSEGPDSGRHFGIAVDDKDAVRAKLAELNVPLLDLKSRFLDFHDPWGNRVEITTYQNIQFSKADHVLRGMGLGHLGKTDNALKELGEKGMLPDPD